MKANLIYFSATYTTKRIVEHIASGLSNEVVTYDVTNTPIEADIELNADELLIVGMPVYAGRIPAQAVSSLNSFKSKHGNTPAIIICVYGNREYDDALVEMQDILSANGFRPISAAAFIAQHSIFPKVAANRPDAADWAIIDDYVSSCKTLLTDYVNAPIVAVKGNRPYKTPGSIPIVPTGSSRCKSCGVCVKLCPAGAINPDDPRKTDADKCIHCGRCILICTQQARKFRSPLYKLASIKFTRDNAKRKTPEIYL